MSFKLIVTYHIYIQSHKNDTFKKKKNSATALLYMCFILAQLLRSINCSYKNSGEKKDYWEIILQYSTHINQKGCFSNANDYFAIMSSVFGFCRIIVLNKVQQGI